MSDGGPGTIVELNPHDALGWIELDAGGRVRFGGTAMKGFRALPTVGTRVEVRGTAPGFAGAVKAVVVVPLEVAPPPDAPPAPPQPAAIAWSDLVARYPRFDDAIDTCVPCVRPAMPLALAPHPLFDPWRGQVARAPTVVDLVIPDFRKRDPLPTPAAHDSFALGRQAWLETSEWPRCGRCGKGLRMCLQLAPSVLADFVPGGRGLVLMYCFACGILKRDDPSVALARFVVPTVLVEGPDVFASDAERQLDGATNRVTARPPRSLAPGSLWLRYRSAQVKSTASSVLFGYERAPLAPPYPDGVDEDEMLDDVGASYEDWVDSAPNAGGIWGGARLGGVAEWDQYDATPRCVHGEQLHLIDHEGGQFLDGAMHVFVCRAGTCPMGIVAEF